MGKLVGPQISKVFSWSQTTFANTTQQTVMIGNQAYTYFLEAGVKLSKSWFGSVGAQVGSTAGQAAEKRILNDVLDPSDIHFMQSSIKNATGEFTVLGNAEALKNGTLNPEVLKMNVWKDTNGKIWTLDHRRLASFRLSGLKEAPVQWTNPNGQMWKMTTKTAGKSVKLKLGGGSTIIVK